MPYRLSYFGTRGGYSVSYIVPGLGEPIRLLFVDNGIPFEDERLPNHLTEEWARIRHTFPFGVVPCLFDGSKQIGQSGAIMRCLGRRHGSRIQLSSLGLNGDSEDETTFIDMVFEGIRDLHSKYVHLIYQNYVNVSLEKIKQEAEKKGFLDQTYPAEFAKLEQLIKTYANGEKFIVGDKVCFFANEETAADLLCGLCPLRGAGHRPDTGPSFARQFSRFKGLS